jgi:hypothetical protein
MLDTASPTTDFHIPPAAPAHDASGRFARGNYGGPGNPFARQVAQFRAAIYRSVTREQVADALKKLIELVAKGHFGAIKLFLEYTIGKPGGDPFQPGAFLSLEEDDDLLDQPEPPAPSDAPSTNALQKPAATPANAAPSPHGSNGGQRPAAVAGAPSLGGANGGGLPNPGAAGGRAPSPHGSNGGQRATPVAATGGTPSAGGGQTVHGAAPAAGAANAPSSTNVICALSPAPPATGGQKRDAKRLLTASLRGKV